MALLVKLEHENLLKLVGYSIEGTEVFLVYEFALYARLDRLIDGTLLIFETCMETRDGV